MLRALVALWLIGPAFAFAQPPAGQQLPRPTFETGVDLISVDVHVVDKNGKPLRDLRAEDFEVDIGGRRRPIASVQFVSYAAPGPKATTPAAVAADRVDPATPRPRRMFVLAVDEHSLHTSNAMAAVAAAERFIDRLQPDDLVGLIGYPTGAASHDMTTDHAAVRREIKKIAGLFNEPANNLNLSPSEIIDCANGDQEALRRVQQRECPNSSCNIRQIQQEATSLVGFMEMMASQSLGALRNVLRGLKDVPGRKTLVLVSGGLVTTDQAGGRANTRAEIALVGREAALANVNVFALHLDWSFIQAVTARRGLRPSYFRESSMAAAGLDAVAGTAGGSLIRVQGTSPDVAFDRVLSETSGHYLLGVEASDDERNGQAQAIRVKVKRGGAQVRSRTFVTIPPRAKLPGAPESLTPAPDVPPVAASVPPPTAKPSAAVASVPPADPPRTPAGPPPTPADKALALAGRYLVEYERQFAAVVLEEQYQQRVSVELGGPPGVRNLRSDLLLIPDPELEWVAFRDVYEVDGRQVRDRDQRLAKLFLGDRASAIEQARRIVDESTRYNLNSDRLVIRRSIMPITALRYLISDNQSRSAFRHQGVKALDGKPALLLDFDERDTPRIIHTDDDSPARGRLWIDPVTGAIMRTELWLELQNPTYRTTLSVRVRVSFAPNEKVGIWLPVEMEEEYKSGRTHVTGLARYTNPRRFGVSTTAVIKAP